MKSIFDEIATAVHALVGDDVEDWEFSALVDAALAAHGA